MLDPFDPPQSGPVLNAFEDQRFRLRTPDGRRVTRSFREIVTEADAAYALDYPQAFYNVAALGLLAFLAQWAFEPRDAAELADRVRRPLSEDEVEDVVGPLRQRFALTGDGPRFMQGPRPEDEAKAKPVEEAVLITHRGDKSFLHRADAEWAVAPDQAALFLFARNTFYEGTGGRGYQKGTNGDTPVRSLVTVPASSDTVDLRRSLWLNVLARDQQDSYPGAYAAPGDGYDGLFWVDPPEEDVPVGGTTLRAGLGWMSAVHWLWFETLDAPAVCVVTGGPLAVGGAAARTLTKRSTGVAYGTKGDLDAGTRADRLFLHPNVPLQVVRDKAGDATGRRPFLVDRTRGLVDAVGASFFGDLGGRQRSPFEPAPAVAQLAQGPVQRLGLTTRLLVFGFHMLSNQKNVHGGVEADTFRYAPLVGASDGETLQLNDLAAVLLDDAGRFAREAARALRNAVQRTAGLGVRAKENPDTGRVEIDTKFATTASVDDPFGADTLAAFWRDVQPRLGAYAAEVAGAAGDPATVRALAAAGDALRETWEANVTRLVRQHYRPVFEHYSLLPRTMPYAHAAQRILSGTLKNLRSTQPAEAA